MEGKIQCFSAAVPPPGQAKSDLEILGLLAEKLGAPGYKSNHEEIRKEISSTITSFSDAAACKHPIWIREETQTDESLAEEQIRFSPVTSSQDTERGDQYPFIALFGSLRFHLGSGTRTEQSARISDCDVKGEIEVSPTDAEKMSLVDSDRIRIRSAAGEIERDIRVNRTIEAGYIYIPTAFNSNDARNLLRLEPLLENDSSGWNSCPVSIEKAETAAVDK